MLKTEFRRTKALTAETLIFNQLVRHTMASSREEDDYELLAAIDFGTTFSGYAYSFKDSPKEIILNPEWGHRFGTHSFKSPTCVLTDKKFKYVSFGYDALKKYTQDIEDQYELFDRFKMTLYKEKVASSKTTVTSRSGNLHPAENIITMALKYLYEHLKSHLKESEGDIDESAIKWVITVPAIWSEGAKQLMRRCAHKAGIIGQLNSKRLILALEPEAASFWCRNLPRNRLSKDKSAPRKLLPGTTYMVVDCGGGTTDITVHEVLEAGDIKEVYTANGGDWGGVKIDDEFVRLLSNIIGEKHTERLKRKYSRDWLEMMTQFEMKKRGYDCNADDTLHMSFSHAIVEAVHQITSFKLADLIQISNTPGVSWIDEHLVLDSKQIEIIFKPVVSKIIEHLDDLLKKPKVQRVSYIFLVGGLCNNALFSSELKNKFGKDRIIIIPPTAGACVLKGAVMFGHAPHRVISRIARKTYGQGVMVEFDPTKHDPKYKKIIDGMEQCDATFNVWIRKGESVQVGECRIFTVYPQSKSTTVSCSTIYSVDREDVTYTDEPGVVKVGEITLQVPDVHLPKSQREIKDYVYFGGTEIHVREEDTARADGDTSECAIDFLSE